MSRHHLDSPRSLLSGLLGQGIKTSLTPEMHEREAERHGLRYVYKIVDLEDDQLTRDGLARLLSSAVRLGFDGLNVTHPVKRAMVSLVDSVTDQVAAIGALNTIVISDGATVGHNTDTTGFESAFRDGFPDVDLEQVVLLGAGGAGTAVAHALVRLGVRRLVVVDTDADHSAVLARSVAALGDITSVTAVEPDDLEASLARASGLINATPVGMATHAGTPVTASLLREELWVADIVYRPLHTEFLDLASNRGCRTLSGAGMAVHQAADAFELISGKEANKDAMFRDFDEMVTVEMQGPDHVNDRPRAVNRERKK